jgi:O-antigen/teichoic acid export membrane protein
LVLGPRWSEAQALLEILAFFGISQVLQSNAYAALIALGKPGLFAKLNALQVTLLLICLVILTPHHGATGAAWAYVIAALGALPVNLFNIARFLRVRIRDYAGAVWRPLVSAALMYGAGRTWGPVLPPGASTSMQALLPFLACVAFGAAAYIAAEVLLWVAAGRPEGAETWLLRLLRLRARR